MMSRKTLGGIVKQVANKHKNSLCSSRSNADSETLPRNTGFLLLLLLLFFNLETVIPGY